MRFSFVLLPLILLTACYNAPQSTRYEGPSYADMEPFKLRVASVEVAEDYQPNLQNSHVDQEFPTPPAEAMKQWAQDRLQAVGTSGVAQVIIKDASVTRTMLPRTKGIKGVFTKDQAERFDARLEVEIRIYGRGTMSDASVETTATRSATLAEDATPVQRKALYDKLTRDLMQLADQELEKNIRAYFGNYLQY